MRRATITEREHRAGPRDFYPRSPCGERLGNLHAGAWHPVISIHALLAESDYANSLVFCHCAQFLSTLSLRRATLRRPHGPPRRGISIHALLAESDGSPPPCERPTKDFYPRSPCGERQTARSLFSISFVFLSTLSLRRATLRGGPWGRRRGISIHALLAESDGI